MVVAAVLVAVSYDVGAYLTIARQGYSYSAADPYPVVAWFPGYGLTICAVDALLGEVRQFAATIGRAEERADG